MRAESGTQPTGNYRIENINGNICDVVFFDDIVKEERESEEENHTVYTYNEYRITVPYREDIETHIDDGLEIWLAYARQHDFDVKANEVRSKRDKLLADTDKNMILDRMGFEIPEHITMTNIISVMTSFFEVLSKANSGDWAVYRQQLRDLTKQKGFPYNVEFPTKPE